MASDFQLSTAGGHHRENWIHSRISRRRLSVLQKVEKGEQYRRMMRAIIDSSDCKFGCEIFFFVERDL